MIDRRINEDHVGRMLHAAERLKQRLLLAALQLAELFTARAAGNTHAGAT